MIIKTIKKIISSIVLGVVVFFTSCGVFAVYTHFKPIEVIETETQRMRVKLESIGVIKVAESELNLKKDIVLGKTKFFRNRNHLSMDFKCFYEYDLKDIVIISEINEKSVVMEIDASKLSLSDVILLEDKSFEVSTFISPRITTEEITQAKDDLKLEALEEFKNDEEFKTLAINSLREKLYKLAESLGFEKIEVLVKE